MAGAVLVSSNKTLDKKADIFRATEYLKTGIL